MLGYLLEPVYNIISFFIKIFLTKAKRHVSQKLGFDNQINIDHYSVDRFAKR